MLQILNQNHVKAYENCKFESNIYSHHLNNSLQIDYVEKRREFFMISSRGSLTYGVTFFSQRKKPNILNQI